MDIYPILSCLFLKMLLENKLALVTTVLQYLTRAAFWKALEGIKWGRSLQVCGLDSAPSPVMHMEGLV